ncbi:DUF2927 domain-containing protein [Octadecabacter sp. G9-8]|uniref:DUF2927 domain-containing protein n=1 Tax=Octadecabacter dasysiphoniae TaxID=2909341 RepID=A0ABS9CSF3_9RHOB|nr:DUF2927 domain-containing protein [Octadecabacter dasysiphoniae]MCF2869677.1 DUF2927 domain-containing protein [Octadecabacter dasysiphoniae]
MKTDAFRTSRHWGAVCLFVALLGACDPADTGQSSADVLVRNFSEIALSNEYDDGFSGRGGVSPLRRWEDPVRFQIVFGAGVLPAQRAKDALSVSQYADRLRQVTGHPVSTSGSPNFIVVIASEGDRAAALQEAALRVPSIAGPPLAILNGLDRDTFCAVAAYATENGGTRYTAAVAVIRAEHDDLRRLSCIHEELAQGLGLPNDSRRTRPSIFNDDDEFSFLTDHDELLLRILYDPRLSAGMTSDTALPIARVIAQELIGEVP